LAGPRATLKKDVVRVAAREKYADRGSEDWVERSGGCAALIRTASPGFSPSSGPGQQAVVGQAPCGGHWNRSTARFPPPPDPSPADRRWSETPLWADAMGAERPQQGRARDGGGGPCARPRKERAAKMEIHRHLL